MEKVVKVSLSGTAFTLTEDANVLFREYLSRFEEHYSDNPSGPEIIEGIEGRMAELLVERGGVNGVVGTATAQEVVDIIGRPEEVFGESDGADDKPKDEEKPKKRLFRNTSDKVVAGVCSGLAAYFAADPVWFRIGFSVFTLLSAFTASGDFWHPGLPIGLYLILAICIPAANTATKRCEMRGVSSSYIEIQKEVENRKEEKPASGALHRIMPAILRCSTEE